jgi:hypothetical protein
LSVGVLDFVTGVCPLLQLALVIKVGHSLAVAVEVHTFLSSL